MKNGNKHKALLASPSDNVATALANLHEGESIKVDENGTTVTLKSDIPFGFKFSISSIKEGSPVLKYGEKIGVASCDIPKGELVHITNLESCRGRGDIAK